MKVQIWHEMIPVEEIDPRGKYSRNMPVSEFLSDNSPVLALDETIVRRVSRTTLGLPDTKLLEHSCHSTVDILAPVVGVEVVYDEWEGLDRSLQERKQESLRDFLNRKTHLPLSHLINQINVVDSLLSIEVSLMYGVYPEKSGSSPGIRFHPSSDRDIHALGFSNHHYFLTVSIGCPKTIQLCNRDIPKSNESNISSIVLIPNECSSQTSRETSGRIVHFREEFAVGSGIYPIKSASIILLTERRSSSIRSYVSIELFLRESSDSSKVPEHYSFLFFPKRTVPKASEAFEYPVRSFFERSRQRDIHHDWIIEKAEKIGYTHEICVIIHGSHGLHSTHDDPKVLRFRVFSCENPRVISGSSCVREELNFPFPRKSAKIVSIITIFASHMLAPRSQRVIDAAAGNILDISKSAQAVSDILRVECFHDTLADIILSYLESSQSDPNSPFVQSKHLPSANFL